MYALFFSPANIFRYFSKKSRKLSPKPLKTPPASPTLLPLSISFHPIIPAHSYISPRMPCPPIPQPSFLGNSETIHG